MYKIPATTLFLGKNLIFMPECHSTSDQLLLLCQKEPLSEGSLVITSHQTAGRGQRGNSWEAQPNRNITFSFLLKPDFLGASEQFYLTMAVSLGIRDILTEETGVKVQIKWPNDILIEEKKICGVLIENQIMGQRISSCVIGIGLNVNQQFFSVPTATSLILVTGLHFDLPVLFEKLLKKIELRYLQLRQKHRQQLENDYLDALYLRNESHLFYTGIGSFQGTIRGIGAFGKLLIENDKTGEVNAFDIKEVRYGSFL